MAAQSSAQTVLVIDDTPDSLRILRIRLESWGFRALTAETEDQGLNLAQNEHPDLIILDMLMPNMNGDEMYNCLHDNPKTRNIPVLFVSALGIPEHVKEEMGLAGGEDYILKPFEADDLKRHIDACLSRHNGNGKH